MTVYKDKALADRICNDLTEYNESQTVFVLINLDQQKIQDYFMDVKLIPTLLEQKLYNYEVKLMTLCELSKRKNYLFKHLIY